MRLIVSTTLLLGFGMAMGIWCSSSRVDAQVANAAVAAPASVVWQYKTIQIDSVSLQSKLSALGLDGWEVFSVSALSAASPHEQMFQVVAKRAY